MPRSYWVVPNQSINPMGTMVPRSNWVPLVSIHNIVLKGDQNISENLYQRGLRQPAWTEAGKVLESSNAVPQ